MARDRLPADLLQTTIPAALRAVTTSRPNKTAVTDLSDSVTYGELLQRSGRLAGRLTELTGADPGGTRVALLLPHGVPSVVGLLAVLQSGAVAVPLDPSAPAPRLADQYRLVDPAAVLVDRSTANSPAVEGLPNRRVIDVSGAAASATQEVRPGTGREADPGSLALLIATSGSTGRPKAVMHSHASQLHNAARYAHGLGIRSTDRIALHAPLTGGQGLVTLLTGLLCGATVCAYPLATSGAASFSPWLRASGVTVLDTLPSVLRHLLPALSARDLRTVRLVRIASEAATATDLEKFRTVFAAGCRLAHVLASAETGIIAQCPDVRGPDTATGRLPVGGPADGVEVELLGDDGQPVRTGEPGQVVVRSRYVALGYFGSDVAGGRFDLSGEVPAVRTGDVAVSTEAGLVVLGRQDLQVKLRGQRVHIDEVEAALLRHPDVREAAVVPIEVNGDVRLRAVVVTAAGPVDPAQIRVAAGGELSAVAVPSELLAVAALPRLPGGKLDRQALSREYGGAGDPAPIAGEPAEDEPATDGPIDGAADTRRRLSAIWRRAFGADRRAEPGRGFLSAGGDSLLAIVITALVAEEFGVELDLATFRADPTVTELAATVDAMLALGRPPSTQDGTIPPAPPPARRLLSFTQLSMWPSTLRPDTAIRTNVAVPYELRGPLEPAALGRAASHVVRRHDILRARFAPDDSGRPRLTISDAAPADLKVVDLRRAADPSAAAAALLHSAAQRPFDLAAEPLLRLTAVRLDDDRWQVHRVNHHLLADPWSWRVVIEEIARCYAAETAGAPCPLGPPPALQFADVATWERRRFAPGTADTRSEVDWWAAALDGWSGAELPLPIRAGHASGSEVTGSGVTGPDVTGSNGVAGLRRWGIPRQVADRLDAIARAERTTLFASRLAVFTALTGLRTGASRLPVGTNVTTRSRADLYDVVGPLTNRVVVPLQFDPALSFREWLRRVTDTVSEVAAHAAIPRLRLQAELRSRGLELPPPTCLFQARTTVPQVTAGPVTITALPRVCVNAAGFELGVSAVDEESACWAAFDTARHDSGAVAEFVSILSEFSAAVSQGPEEPLVRLPAAGW